MKNIAGPTNESNEKGDSNGHNALPLSGPQITTRDVEVEYVGFRPFVDFAAREVRHASKVFQPERQEHEVYSTCKLSDVAEPRLIDVEPFTRGTRPWTVNDGTKPALKAAKAAQDAFSLVAYLAPTEPCEGGRKGCHCNPEDPSTFCVRRGGGSVARSSRAMVFDLDHADRAKLRARLAELGIAYAALSTFSIANSDGTARLRLIVVLSRSLTPAEFTAVWPVIAQALDKAYTLDETEWGIDKACSSIAGLYYVGVPQDHASAAWSEVVDGQAVDVDAILALHAPVESSASVMDRESVTPTGPSLYRLCYEEIQRSQPHVRWFGAEQTTFQHARCLQNANHTQPLPDDEVPTDDAHLLPANDHANLGGYHCFHDHCSNLREPGVALDFIKQTFLEEFRRARDRFDEQEGLAGLRRFFEGRKKSDATKGRERFVYCPADLGEACRTMTRELASLDDLYQRAAALVRLTPWTAEQQTEEPHIRRDVGTTIIRTLEPPTLKRLLSDLVYWTRPVAKKKAAKKKSTPSEGEGSSPEAPDNGAIEFDYKAIEPPDSVVSGILAEGMWPGIRPLRSVSETPVIRPDGRIVMRGYDEGIYVTPLQEYPDVPQAVSREEAQRCAQSVLELVTDFPFAGEEHKSAWLAAALTIAGRSAIQGCVPMFFAEAPVRASGKTKLLEVLSRITTGRGAALLTAPADDAEWDKRILGVLMAGDRVLCLDNVTGTFGSASLDKLLTGNVYRGRVLGRNDMPIFHTGHLTVIASGNNATLKGDAASRTVLIRITPKEEHPETRVNFKFPSLVRHAEENHSFYLTCLLKILAAFIQAGKPDQQLPACRFAEWSWIRDAVVWLGLSDPLNTQSQIAIDDDAELEAFGNLLSHIEGIQQGGGARAHTTRELRELLTGTPKDVPSEVMRERRAAWAALQTDPRNPEPPSVEQMGKLFRALRDRNVGGRRIVVADKTRAGVALWQVRK
jgi:hypothetical protein